MSVSAVGLRAQEQQTPKKDFLEVTADRLVAADPHARPMVEPHLAIDPDNPKHWLAAVIVITADYSSFDCASFVSFDGGQTWARHDFEYSQCGDPWVAIMPGGAALLTVLAAKSPNDPDQLFVYRSEDGGRNWDDHVSLGVGHDHETFVVGQPGSKYEGNVFVASTQSFPEKTSGKVLDSIFVARSTDQGKTFQPPTHFFFSKLAKNTMNPVLLPDGTLLVTFSEYGRTRLDGQARLDREHDWLMRSSDGGKEFSPPALVTESCARSWEWLALNNSPDLFPGRLYWLCTDGSYENILLHYSPDSGERWSKPIIVNQGSGARPYTRTPVIAVNQEGIVGVTWYDGRSDPGVFKGFFRCQELYFAASLDGGETFLPEMKVSTGKSCPLSPKNGDVGLRFPAGGDYSGLVAGPDHSFYLLWSDSRNGVYQLWTATVKVHGRPIRAKSLPASIGQ
jgi:hypothetical protein